MEYMQYFIENWTVIVAFVCVIILAVQRIVEFVSLPTEKKMAEVKARLLEWVRQAEADLGSGTGTFKLAQVYDLFCEKYPELKKWISIDDLNKLVQEALKQMEKEFSADETVKINALKLSK